jgi:hypothetical protein
MDYQAVYSDWWHTKMPHRLAASFPKFVNHEKLCLEFRVNLEQINYVVKSQME